MRHPISFSANRTPSSQSLLVSIFKFFQSITRAPIPFLPRSLWSIPHSRYFSLEAMVSALSVLTRLECLIIDFESPPSRPHQYGQRLPPQTRTLLPVLNRLTFNRATEYLEDLVAQVDAPLLDMLEIDFFYELIFDTLRFTQFISRTLKFRAYDEARVKFYEWGVTVKLLRTFYGSIKLGISCSESDLQLSSVAQVCSSSFPPAFLLVVEHLYIQNMYWDRLLGSTLGRRH